MIYRVVDRIPDLKFSLLGFGCWSLGNSSNWTNSNDESSIEAIKTAIEQGINFFDTAPVYGFGTSEILLGRAIKGYSREKLIIASKCGLVWDDKHQTKNELSESSIMNEIDSSLNRLGLDYIDIYQLHWPDPNTPLDKVLSTMQKIIDNNKIRYIGFSNFCLSDIKQFSNNKKIVSFQGLYNVLEQNSNSYHNINLGYRMKDDILPFCKEMGLAVFPYSPLMQGLLTDSFNISKIDSKDVRNANPNLKDKVYLDKVDKLKNYSKKIGVKLIELAYGWLKYQKAITSIISGAKSKEQVLSNINALECDVIGEKEFNEINKIVEQ